MGSCGTDVFNTSYETILEFTTGASHPPPAGFIQPPTIAFHVENHYPKANTCFNTLYLPVKRPLTSCDTFIYSMVYGILNSARFGHV